MRIKIIFEDNHLLVVEKPVNMPTQGDNSGDLDLLTFLKKDLKVRYEKPGNVYLGLVHRLDRPVGGVMVFAKTSKAASRLSAQIREGNLEKNYLAVVRGSLKNKNGRLHNHLIKDYRRNVVAVVPESTPGAKEAWLDYWVIGEQEGMSLLQIALGTGVPIRFGCSSRPSAIRSMAIKIGSQINRAGNNWLYSPLSFVCDIRFPKSIWDLEQLLPGPTLGQFFNSPGWTYPHRFKLLMIRVY